MLENSVDKSTVDCWSVKIGRKTCNLSLVQRNCARSRSQSALHNFKNWVEGSGEENSLYNWELKRSWGENRSPCWNQEARSSICRCPLVQR